MTEERAKKVLQEQIDIIQEYDEEDIEALEMAIKALEQQSKTGHWISLGGVPSSLGVYRWCSNCDCGIAVNEFHRNHYNFCPNCGVKMEGEDEND